MALRNQTRFHYLPSSLITGGTGIVLAIIAVTVSLWDYRIHVQALLDGRFTQVTEFPLQDSLPALEGGLSNLEAFKVTASPSIKANPDRSVWITRGLERLTMEYHTDKMLFDSVMLLLWTSDSVTQMKSFTARQASWEVSPHPENTDWLEVVGVFVSRPALLSFRSIDSSVRIFERVEGKALHVVRGRYQHRQEQVIEPDTVYPVNDSSGSLQVLARGDALAVVNSSPKPERLRIIRMKESQWNNVEVNAHSIHVYRNLLESASGPVLAYSSPGTPFLKVARPEEAPPVFFLLRL